MFDTICTAVCDRCDSSTACRLCRLEPHLLHSYSPLPHIQFTVYLDTGSGKHRQFINITELAETFGKEWCNTLLWYYVFTGEDCTSAFKVKSKVTSPKKLMKSPRHHKTFRRCVDSEGNLPLLLLHYNSSRNTHIYSCIYIYIYICMNIYTLLSFILDSSARRGQSHQTSLLR